MKTKMFERRLNKKLQLNFAVSKILLLAYKLSGKPKMVLLLALLILEKFGSPSWLGKEYKSY